MEYTKGDWRKWTDAQGICGIGHPSAPYALAMLTDSFVPARGYWYNQNWGQEAIAEREANANLMIAASDMYEALVQVGTVLYAEYGRLRPQPRGPEWDNVQRLMRTIDAALAKAEGRRMP